MTVCHKNSLYLLPNQSYMAKETTRELYRAIRQDYNKLSELREFGAKKHTLAWVLGKLAKKYYKSPRTIENIVFKQGSVTQ